MTDPVHLPADVVAFLADLSGGSTVAQAEAEAARLLGKYGGAVNGVSPAVHVRSEHNASGYDTVSTAVLRPEGTLQVTARFAVIYGSDQVIGYRCTVIEAKLNGTLVTDPDRAKRLAARAGIPEPALMTWVDGPQ